MSTRLIARLMPAFTWRWGLNSTYGLEQLTFWWALERRLRAGGFDILHVQDPMLAFWCRRARLAGRLKTKEILAHGTEESPEFLAQFEYVQHLAPWHRERGCGTDLRPQTLDLRPEEKVSCELSAVGCGGAQGAERMAQSAEGGEQGARDEGGNLKPEEKKNFSQSTQSTQRKRFGVELRSDTTTLSSAAPAISARNIFGGTNEAPMLRHGVASQGKPSTRHQAPRRISWAIPNFVDTALFRPWEGADAEAVRAERARLGIPSEALVVGCVAALKKTHKRLDWLITECARAISTRENDRAPLHLLLIGASGDETAEVEALATGTLPRQVHILRDIGRGDMPGCYRMMDVFVLPSLFEMMPIAVLEAMSSGLPVIANTHPVLEWMVGAGEKDHRPQTLDHRPAEMDEGGKLRPEEKTDFSQSTQSTLRKRFGVELRSDTTTLSSACHGVVRDAGRSRAVSANSARNLSGYENDRFSQSAQSAQRGDSDGELRSDNTTFFSAASANSARNISGGANEEPMLRAEGAAGGACLDMACEGELAAFLCDLTPGWIAERGGNARARAVELFSVDAVIGRCIEMYGEVVGAKGERP